MNGDTLAPGRLYLRILLEPALATADAERTRIVDAFEAAGIDLAEPPEPHPRGGWTVFALGIRSDDDFDRLAATLVENDLLNVV